MNVPGTTAKETWRNTCGCGRMLLQTRGSFSSRCRTMPTCTTQNIATTGPCRCFHGTKRTRVPVSHRTVPGKLASPLGSMQDAVTEHEQHSAAEAKATVPPPRLPESIVAGLGIEWQRLWTAFQYDVNTLTDSLLQPTRCYTCWMAFMQSIWPSGSVSSESYLRAAAPSRLLRIPFPLQATATSVRSIRVCGCSSI